MIEELSKMRNTLQALPITTIEPINQPITQDFSANSKICNIENNNNNSNHDSLNLNLINNDNSSQNLNNSKLNFYNNNINNNSNFKNINYNHTPLNLSLESKHLTQAASPVSIANPIHFNKHLQLVTTHKVHQLNQIT